MPVRYRLGKAFESFLKQTRALGKNKVTLIGEDHLGNKYFESERPNHSRPIQRHFEKKSYDGITNIVDAVHVPPAWDAWLRFRRKDPPSEIEVRESEEYFQDNQARASERQASPPAENKQVSKRPYPKLPLSRK